MPLTVPPHWEVGLRGGFFCEAMRTDWPAGTDFTVTLRQLGVTHVALGRQGRGTSCRTRDARWLQFWTPPLTRGLWRVEVTWAGMPGDPVVAGTLRALPDDLAWHTFDHRDAYPAGVYRAGARRLGGEG